MFEERSDEFCIWVLALCKNTKHLVHLISLSLHPRPRIPSPFASLRPNLPLSFPACRKTKTTIPPQPENSDTICTPNKLYYREERGKKVYYEIYIDSLLLVNFVMNLYCLELVNLIFLRTATRRRVVLGAITGAVLYLVPFLLPGEGWLKILIFFPAAAVVMILITFRTDGINSFFKVFGLLMLSTFALGGSMIFLFRIFPGLHNIMTGILGIMGVGALVFMEAAHLIGHSRQQDLCKVELIGKGAKITVNALVDTGNGLVEPVSGSPVCILEKTVFESLWRTGKPEGFRVIPYHSVGKKNGILYGYLIPEIRINRNGMVRSCRNIYVGVIEEQLSAQGGYCMILNPKLFEAGEGLVG